MGKGHKSRKVALFKSICTLAFLAASLSSAPSYAADDENYNIRVTVEPWMTQIDSKSNSNWPATPDKWRSFFAFYGSPEENGSKTGATDTILGHVTYTLTTASGSPVAGAMVSLIGKGRGHARDFGNKGVGKVDEPRATDENGRVSFVYSFQGYWPSLKDFVTLRLGRVTNPSALVFFTPEPRPESLLKTPCYSSCIATESPESRWFDATSNPIGLKARDLFQIDLVPTVEGIEDAQIDKDQIWLHVINPVLQVPRVANLDDPYFSTGFVSVGGRSRGNAVGALAEARAGSLLGHPFSSVTDLWYACTQVHKKVSYQVPKDCTLLSKKYDKEFGLFVIPSAALNTYVMGGYLISNPAGKVTVMFPTASKQIK